MEKEESSINNTRTTCEQKSEKWEEININSSSIKKCSINSLEISKDIKIHIVNIKEFDRDLNSIFYVFLCS